MKYPMKLKRKVFFAVVIFWIVSVALLFICGFEKTRKILGFLSSIIGLPVGILSLVGIISIIDENKLINRTLIKAGKNDQQEWEKMEKQM